MTTTVNLDGAECLVFEWKGKDEEQLKEFVGDRLQRVRPEDRVAELKDEPGDVFAMQYVQPGGLLVKPVKRPDARPLHIPSDLSWARALFLAAPE